MKVLKLLNNQNGMSMVNVMMAAAMMGGLALVMTQLGTNSAKIQRKAIESQDMNAFINNLEKNMLNHDACKKTFTGITGLNTNGSEVPLPNGIKNFNGTVIYANPSSPLKTWNIDNITAKRLAGTNLQLRVLLKKKNIGKSYGAEEITKTINLDARYISGGKVEECFSQLDSAVTTSVAKAREEACKDIDPNGTYTPSGGCVLSDAYKKTLFEDGLSQMPSTPVYKNAAGLLSVVAPRVTVRCTLNHKRCSRTNYQDCTPSCPSGYHNAGRASGRFDVSEGTWNKKCCRNYHCQKTNNDGSLLLQ